MSADQKPTSMVPMRPGIPALRGILNSEAIKARFSEVLGKRAPGFLSSVLSAAAMNPQLAEADPMSIAQAAMIAASLDLPVNPSLGFAYLVPYGGYAQFQLGYKGFIQLGMRSGQYRLMNATHVFEGQLVENNPFTGELVFDAGAKISDDVSGYVAYFRLLNGFEKYKYMTTLELKQHAQKYSQVFRKGKGKWVDDFPAMALKTVIKLLLSKWGLLSIDIQRALEVDQGVVRPDGEIEYADHSEQASADVGGEVAPIETQTSKVKDKLKGRGKPKVEEPAAASGRDAAPGPDGLITGEQQRAFNAAFDAARLGDDDWAEISEALGGPPSVPDIPAAKFDRAMELVGELAGRRS